MRTGSEVNTPQPPEQVAAQAFMQLKGFPDAEARNMIRVEDQYCWYFYYDIEDEGEIELEVSWSESDGWSTMISSFRPYQGS